VDEHWCDIFDLANALIGCSREENFGKIRTLEKAAGIGGLLSSVSVSILEIEESYILVSPLRTDTETGGTVQSS
jgi:hypothetical protein